MPTRRITEERSGKIPTTSVRRRISLFKRSCGLMPLCQTTALYAGGRQALKDDREELSCDVALEDPQDLLARVAALHPAGRVIARPWIAHHADVGDHPKSGVRGAIPSAAQALPGGLSR